MSLTLSLPPQIEEALNVEATQLGLTLEEYAILLLTQRGSFSGTPRTGADLVAYWQREGVIGSRSDIEDSPSYARHLRARSQRRHRE
jgi:hypothetical protein